MVKIIWFSIFLMKHIKIVILILQKEKTINLECDTDERYLDYCDLGLDNEDETKFKMLENLTIETKKLVILRRGDLKLC